MERILRAFLDIQATPGAVPVDGDAVAGEVRPAATHGGPLGVPSGELPATGARIEFSTALVGPPGALKRPFQAWFSVQLPCCGFFRLDGQGRVFEGSRYYDTAGLLARLGIPT